MNEKKHFITDVNTLDEIIKLEAELKNVNIKINLINMVPIAALLSSYAIFGIILTDPTDIFFAGSIFGLLSGAGIITKFNPNNRKYYGEGLEPFDYLSDYSPSLYEQRDDLIEKLKKLREEISDKGKVL